MSALDVSGIRSMGSGGGSSVMGGGGGSSVMGGGGDSSVAADNWNSASIKMFGLRSQFLQQQHQHQQQQQQQHQQQSVQVNHPRLLSTTCGVKRRQAATTCLCVMQAFFKRDNRCYRTLMMTLLMAMLLMAMLLMAMLLMLWSGNGSVVPAVCFRGLHSVTSRRVSYGAVTFALRAAFSCRHSLPCGTC